MSSLLTCEYVMTATMVTFCLCSGSPLLKQFVLVYENDILIFSLAIHSLRCGDLGNDF